MSQEKVVKTGLETPATTTSKNGQTPKMTVLIINQQSASSKNKGAYLKNKTHRREKTLLPSITKNNIEFQNEDFDQTSKFNEKHRYFKILTSKKPCNRSPASKTVLDPYVPKKAESPIRCLSP